MRVRKPLLLSLGAMLLITGLSHGPAWARRDLKAYLEVSQVLDAERAGMTEVLTYSAASAGGDATFDGHRLQGQASYRYERRIPSNGKTNGGDNHNGLARGAYKLSENLKLDASALATRARNDLRNGIDSRNGSNQVYSVNIGPTLQTRAAMLDLNASYHLGYVNVDDPDEVTETGSILPTDRYDQSLRHKVQASVGMKPGDLPFGWTVSGNYDREDTDWLDQKSVNNEVRAQVLMPLNSTFALKGSVGYEDVEVGERRASFDASGVPLVDAKGRYIVDPTSPRVLSYDYRGLSYDAGFSWKPNPRLALDMSFGKNDGKTAINGALDYKISASIGLRASVSSGLDSFGRGLNNSLGRCSFGGTSGCLGNALSQISPYNSYSRRASLSLNGESGRWNGELGIGLSRRQYLVPASLDPFGIYRRSQNDYWVQANLARKIGDSGTIASGIYAGTSNPLIGRAFKQTNFGANMSYNRAITHRLSGVTSLGYSTSHQKSGDTFSTASARVGMRYDFRPDGKRSSYVYRTLWIFGPSIPIDAGPRILLR
ncbi:hypothetical protein [Aquisediminimonas sediminicola]|uniref:hypothetical protein n=1 Tax=Alteraquisediminimonas sediminicola TaxID=2676787 RepID=UPI001C8DA399|nr:hypothetical protein [Aquisediminimonas sediminicola]